ncbi:MAG: YceG family protein [Bacillota bacterium]|nr:YceG family protein [Bacillota bacterium]
MSEIHESDKNDEVAVRTETDAYKASSDIGKKLYAEETYFYKPWQYSDYEVYAATLKTTYEEINIWGNQHAMIRPGWKSENGKVYIPNIFAKVVGTHKNKSIYRKEMKFLTHEPNTLVFMGFPLFFQRKLKEVKRNYFFSLDIHGNIDKTKLMSSSYWRYGKLRMSVQNAIADRIIDFCKLHRFKNYESCLYGSKMSMVSGAMDLIKGFGININLPIKAEDIAKIKVFEVLCNLEEPLLKIIALFDYPANVPKVIVYDNGMMRNSKITFADAVKLSFMSSMGIDVIVYSPAGFSDIEDFIDNRYFDVHKLETVAYNLRYNKWFFF